MAALHLYEYYMGKPGHIPTSIPFGSLGVQNWSGSRVDGENGTNPFSSQQVGRLSVKTTSSITGYHHLDVCVLQDRADRE